MSEYVPNYSYIYVGEMFGYDQMWNLYVGFNNENENLTTDFMFIHGYMTEFHCNSTEPLSIEQGKTALTVARQVLEAYATNFNASYCSQFIQFFDEVVPDQNQTIRIGDLVLQVWANGQNLDWAYSPNDIPCAGKGFVTYISDDRHTTALNDYWAIFPIGSTEMNVSEQEATNIALSHILQFAEEKRLLVKSIDAELSFVRDYEGRRGDSYTYYPAWSLEATFSDRINDQLSYSYNVKLWADSGEIYFSSSYSYDKPAYDYVPVFALATSLTLTLVASISYIVHRKRSKKTGDKTNIVFLLSSPSA